MRSYGATVVLGQPAFSQWPHHAAFMETPVVKLQRVDVRYTVSTYRALFPVIRLRCFTERGPLFGAVALLGLFRPLSWLKFGNARVLWPCFWRCLHIPAVMLASDKAGQNPRNRLPLHPNSGTKEAPWPAARDLLLLFGDAVLGY
ncbi:hypothetical protein TraAM80_10064 [Trypanosoma rangeli]|uniref:Uncharacterized protein n=1 Tax=Trypanosoma rangeli TaxID=5698 RepID=A0A3R7LY37_TRYRA|nr:uncharacterized protein TraAM80_10064 [Trypanosoma rangeli]RNE95865.1 hypothetical protein TraAM80_10064 [Trypanosoma rangeli]|eukprot:RNE95865.1 hypothetical protein TraAM80_10064 [Trypanosoma rangeli]